MATQCIGYELSTNITIFVTCFVHLYVVSAYRSQSFTSSFTNYIKVQDAWGSPVSGNLPLVLE